MTTEAIIVYAHAGRWYIGVYDLAKQRMICHLGRDKRGYGSQGAALGDLARISTAGRRYSPWGNETLDWEGGL